MVWNCSGVFNWAFLLLAIVALKMFLENINKYGVRINPRLWVTFAFGDLHDDRLELPVFLLVFANVSLFITLKTEQALSKDILSWKQGVPIHTANLAALLVLPLLYIQHKADCIGLVSSLLMCTLYTVLFMKTLSYVQVNKWCRDSRIVTNNNTICCNRRGLKKDSAGLVTPSCNELRRRRFYSLTPESEGAERIRAERNRGSTTTGFSFHDHATVAEIDEEVVDPFYAMDESSGATHSSSKPSPPLLMDGGVANQLSVRLTRTRLLTSTDRNAADDERSDTSADLMKELLDLSASPVSSCSPTAGGSGSPVAGSDASMMEYSFEEEELKEADITGAESIALYRKIQENTKSFNKPQRADVIYPDNLSVGDLYYFWFAPTLCYEINFPRTRMIRTSFLLKRALEVFVCSQVCLCIVQQYIMPSVVSALIPFSNMEFSLVSERLLKLALPNHLLWLISFYVLFHSFLNTLAEILQFADRSFFRDWWNASNLETFWKNWNLPVHRWCVRHVYKPLLGMGYSKKVAMVVVFVISAFFHEYLLSVPLRMFGIWIGLGMAAQAPLVFFSRFIERKFGPRWGNMIVWLSLIIGQPLIIMSYYHDFVVQHYGSHLIQAFGNDTV